MASEGQSEVPAPAQTLGQSGRSVANGSDGSCDAGALRPSSEGGGLWSGSGPPSRCSSSASEPQCAGGELAAGSSVGLRSAAPLAPSLALLCGQDDIWSPSVEPVLRPRTSSVCDESARSRSVPLSGGSPMPLSVSHSVATLQRIEEWEAWLPQLGSIEIATPPPFVKRDDAGDRVCVTSSRSTGTQESSAAARTSTQDSGSSSLNIISARLPGDAPRSSAPEAAVVPTLALSSADPAAPSKPELIDVAETSAGRSIDDLVFMLGSLLGSGSVPPLLRPPLSTSSAGGGTPTSSTSGGTGSSSVAASSARYEGSFHGDVIRVRSSNGATRGLPVPYDVGRGASLSESHASFVNGGGISGSPRSSGRIPRRQGGGRDNRLGLYTSRGYPPPYPSPAQGMPGTSSGGDFGAGNWSSAYGVPPAAHYSPHLVSRGVPPPPRPQPFWHGGSSGAVGFASPEAYSGGADEWRGAGGWQQPPSPALLHQQRFYAPPLLQRHALAPPLSYPPMHAPAPGMDVGAGAASMVGGSSFYAHAAGGGVGSLAPPLSSDWAGGAPSRAAGAFSGGPGVVGGGGATHRDIGAAAATTQYYAGGTGR